MSAGLDDYEWPRTRGCLHAWLLRDYASWLFPALKAEWKAPGVLRFDPFAQNGKTGEEPYEFGKATGWLNIQRDLRPFTVYVLARLRPWSDRQPYEPERVRGMAFVKDLLQLHEHFMALLEAKKTEQSKKKE